MASILRVVCYLAVFMNLVQFLSAQMMPEVIEACYRNNSRLLRERGFPLNMAALLELIQKVEMNPTAALDLRTMAFTLLHKLQLDGIERVPSISESEYVTPYAMRGSQYIKYTILLGKLVAGHDKFFPEGSLTDVEMCALHTMFSSSVDPWQRGDEDTVCPTMLSNRHARQANQRSRCPIEGGVINTRWGTLSPNHVIGAIASALEFQQVRVGRLVDQPNAEPRISQAQIPPFHSGRLSNDDVELLENFEPQSPERAGRLEEMLNTEQKKYYQKLQELPESETVTNTWATALAGDLSEVIIYQGPYGSTLELGLNGQWNDTLIPRAFYLEKAGPWHMTAAEVTGGLDGLIIASKVNQWTKTLSRLRLSQVLDMYYSDRGVSFNSSYRVCSRSTLVRNILDLDRLLNETTNFARVLYYNSRNNLMLTNIEDLSNNAVTVFNQQLESFLTSVTCVSNSTLPPRIILHVILDSTWWGYEAIKLLGVLSEAIHVSRHSSSIGIVAGRGSESPWFVNTTNSYTDFMQGVSKITTWPTDLDLPLSLTVLLEELHNNSIEELQSGAVGGPSHVVLVLGYSATISNNDQSTIQETLNMIRNQQRDVHFLYVTSSQNQNHFQNFVKSDSQNVESVVVVADTNPETVVNSVVEKLRQVPWRVLSNLCNNTARGTAVSGEMEDYVTPGQQNIYRVHPDYLQGVTKLTLKFRGSGYGILSVCWSRQQPTESQSTNCIEVSGHEESLLTVNTPCGSGTCLPLYFVVNVNTTYNKCAEDDCRFPDQVRFTLLQEGLRCIVFNADNSTTLQPVSSVAVSIPVETIAMLLIFATFLSSVSQILL